MSKSTKIALRQSINLFKNGSCSTSFGKAIYCFSIKVLSVLKGFSVFFEFRVLQFDSSISTNRSRRLFLASGLLFIGGCATTSTSKECMALSGGEDQMDCLFGKIFPQVARGALIGAIAGAVLGGVVAFAMSGDPVTGLVVGGIVGGIVGGVVAYYNFTL